MYVITAASLVDCMVVVWWLYGGCTVVLKVAPPEKTARAVPFPRRPHESPRCTAHTLRGCQRTAQVCLRRQSQEGRCLHFAATPRRDSCAARVARMTPSWPRSWGNLGRLSRFSRRNAWANLHPSGHPNAFLACAANQPRRGIQRSARVEWKALAL